MGLRRLLFLGSLAMIIAILLAYVGCEERVVGDRWIETRISGVVREAVGGNPIDSATIVVGDNEDTLDHSFSDSLGNYEVTPMALGPNHELDYMVTCSRAGYQSQTDTVHTTPNSRSFDSVNFTLVPE